MTGENMRDTVIKVSKKTGIPSKKILDMLYSLRSGDPLDNNELVQRVGVSRNALNQAKEMLASHLMPVSRNTQLKPKHASERLGLTPKGYIPEEMLWKILEGKVYKNSLELLSSIANQRPSPDRNYDQFTATTETTARRASLLNFFDDINGKRLMFLGDDDFTSIAVANLGGAKKTTVVDIDDRLLKEIDTVANINQYNIQTIKYDARKKLPTHLLGQFDVVFTDPPYTTEGVELFTSRAIELLDQNNNAARIYLCYGNSDRAKERYLPIYDTLTSSGLMIRWVFDKFNRYHGAESIGSASSLFVTETTPKTKALVTGIYEKPIYTNN